MNELFRIDDIKSDDPLKKQKEKAINEVKEYLGLIYNFTLITSYHHGIYILNDKVHKELPNLHYLV